jgi:DMATS type aromatic prenyltransferase
MPHHILKEQDAYAQVLQNALELYNYDRSIRSEVLGWFRESILPFLRPRSKSKWIPHLTHHRSAFEPSINTFGDGLTDKTVRFTIEPIGSSAGTEKDMWNQDVQLEILNRVKEKVKELDLELFNHFSQAFFIYPKDEWRKFQPIPKPSPSCFLAFDINPSQGVSGINPKAYLFPQLKSHQTGISPGSIVEESIVQLHNPSTFNILPALETLMEYLQEPGSALTLNDVDNIGFDCIAPTKSSKKQSTHIPGATPSKQQRTSIHSVVFSPKTSKT